MKYIHLVHAEIICLFIQLCKNANEPVYRKGLTQLQLWLFSYCIGNTCSVHTCTVRQLKMFLILTLTLHSSSSVPVFPKLASNLLPLRASFQNIFNYKLCGKVFNW